ncbi:MAG: 2-C-methyl-D-erythritol 2,4-cyclodiphosphate synthase [Clostridia bacterium]|nr:2-C-methyl-D-erythritol 2,4-cyclodiphosphate synthase [Clostridia bacterium]
MRIGHGYDVHKFTEGDHIIIGGVKIPFEKKLEAHSDGDVLAHAIADSLLGACGERDIGYFFPDTDIKYKNANSLDLLSNVKKIISDKGYDICNIDSTIIAQAPKMAPHIESMRVNLANALEINVDDINVKATTEEKLGFTGRKEGIAAHAVCLLKRKA